MGAEISRSKFSNDDFVNFKYNLSRETSHLRELLDSDKFCNKGYSTGIELEGWLLNMNNEPSATNHDFLSKTNHPQIVSELNQCSFEINGLPLDFSKDSVTQMIQEVSTLMNVCRRQAKSMKLNPILIGCPPTFEESHLKFMTNKERFKALQEQILLQNKNHEITIHIRGEDELKRTYKHIMLASATAALHIQLKLPYELAAQFYNTALIISAPIVAATANTPFMFNKQLWHESRIPIFEHSVNTAPSIQHRRNPRALFANDFITHPIEFFESNLNDYPIILATPEDSPLEEFKHINLHNGTIWRWNRLVLGQTSGTPHIRLEHRTIPSGPSLIDTHANIAFFLGLLYELGTLTIPLEKYMPFIQTEKNFYQAAKFGLDAKIKWIDQEIYSVRDLILQRLIPESIRGLKKAGMDSDENIRLVSSVLAKRVETGQTGSQWQMDYTKKHGMNMRKLAEAYLENQKSGAPVSNWPKP